MQGGVRQQLEQDHKNIEASWKLMKYYCWKSTFVKVYVVLSCALEFIQKLRNINISSYY